MEPDCRRIVKEILPAIRASIADIMDNEYHYKQTEIAKRLGLVQVAVSKYLNGKYSKKVADVKTYIMQHDLARSIVNDMVNDGSRDAIDRQINNLCSRLSTSL